MDNKNAKQFVNKVFELIKNSVTVSDLEAIQDKLEKISQDFKILDKNRMKIEIYPKIDFSIKDNDIEELIEKGIIDNEHNFINENIAKLTDPLSKLLYAMAWKNGDLKKVKHIIKGVLNANENIDYDQEGALIFYHFGKYLTKDLSHPIIDQHVIRAYEIFQLNGDNNDEIGSLRKLATIKKNHKKIIESYKEWLKTIVANINLENEPDYLYHIDKLLFETGKTIKIRNKSAKNNQD